jgi:hypothetical protein
MSYSTADEKLNEMIEAMGAESGKLFHILENELLWLTLQWVDFEELFGTKPTRIDIMNESAPVFFYRIQKVYWEQLLLGFSRLLDPAKTQVKGVYKANCTYAALLRQVNTPDFNDDLKRCIEKSKFCRDWRNRKIAHMDYEVYVKGGASTPLENASRKDFTEVLSLLQQLHNDIRLHYKLGTCSFHHVKINSHAGQLLRMLENGLRFREQDFARMDKEIPMDMNFKSRV